MKNKLIFEPKPWQVEAYDKLSSVDSKVKLLQKTGGGGKTYSAFYYFCMTRKITDSVIVIAKPKEIDEWKKWFDDDFNVIFISKGRVSSKTLFDSYSFENVSLVIVDEADHGLSSETSNTFKNFNTIVNDSDETLLISATLFERDFISSIPIMMLIGYTKEYLHQYFKIGYNPHAKFVPLIKGGNKKQREEYVSLVDMYGYVEYEDIEYKKIELEDKFNNNGFDKGDITRVKNNIMIETPKEWLKWLNVIQRESFNPFLNIPIEEVAIKYPLLKRLSSGINRDEDGNPLLYETYKFDKLSELLSGINTKTMIFYESKSEKELLQLYFENREDKVQFFNQDVEIDTSVDIYIGQFASMSRGIDMKDLQNVIMFSPTDKFKNWKQAQFRIGRENSYYNNVFEYRLIPKGTVQEKMYANLDSEKNNTASLVKKKK